MANLTTYLILVRHGPKDNYSEKADRNKPLKQGGKEVREVASVFAETLSIQLQNESDCIVIDQFCHGSHTVVLETGEILSDALQRSGVAINPDQIEKKPVLAPECFWKASDRKDRRKVGELLLYHLTKLSTQGKASHSQSNAILVVGHQPQLGWIAETILGRTVPICRSGIVCLAINRSCLHLIDWLLRWWLRWLLWAISPSDPEITKQLREKVKSKMELAGILGGVIIFFSAFCSVGSWTRIR
jgi:phosphohistidine phosphatase SixA